MSSNEENEVTRESTSGVEYSVLDTPSSVALDYIEANSYSELSPVGGFSTHHVYIKCSEIKNSLLPIEANPREPSKSNVVKDMRDTLGDVPEDFIKWNNGITVICESAGFSDDSIELNFAEEREGICNGGHTYYAIQTTQGDISDAAVHLEIIEIPTNGSDDRKQTIVDIASKRNAVNNLDDSSRADFLDLYSPFKQKMNEPQLVSWHENDSDALDTSIDAKTFIRNLAIVDPKRSYHAVVSPNKSNHKGDATSPGNTHGTWYSDALDAHRDDARIPLYHMSPLIDDIFDIRDLLSHSIVEDDYFSGFRRQSFYQEVIKKGEDEVEKRKLRRNDLEEDTGAELNKPVEAMLLGAFRSNVYLYSGSPDSIDYIGWIRKPDDLWDVRKSKLMQELIDTYDDANNDYQSFIWNNAPYDLELYPHGGIDPDWPDESLDIIYDVETGDKYTVDTGEPTDETHYYLDTESGQGIIGLDEVDNPDPDNIYQLE